MHVTFSRQENNFWQNYDILDLDNFQVRLQVRLQYWVAILCNQLLPEFQAINLKLCTDVIGILKMCMWLLAGKKILFDKVTAFWT